MTTTKNPTALKSLAVRKNVRVMWISLCIAGFAMLLGSLAVGRGGGSSTLATIGLLMAVWSHRARIVEVFDRHLAVKLAPLARTVRVRFEDIEDVTRKGKKLVVVHRDGERTRELNVPLNMLADEDAAWLEDHLTRRHAAA